MISSVSRALFLFPSPAPTTAGPWFMGIPSGLLTLNPSPTLYRSLCFPARALLPATSNVTPSPSLSLTGLWPELVPPPLKPFPRSLHFLEPVKRLNHRNLLLRISEGKHATNLPCGDVNTTRQDDASTPPWVQKIPPSYHLGNCYAIALGIGQVWSKI